MLGDVKIVIGKVIKVLRDDSFYAGKLLNTLRYREMISKFESKHDKEVLTSYISDDLVGLTSIETCSRLGRHFGIDIADMFGLLYKQEVSETDRFKIILPTEDEYKNGFNLVLRIEVEGLEDLIPNKQRYNDDEGLETWAEEIGVVNINRNLRFATDDEVNKVASILAADYYMKKTMTDIPDEKIDKALDIFNQYKTEKESSYYSIDLPHGTFIIQIKLYDGRLHSDGKLSVDKCVEQYFINKEDEINFVGEWDLLK